MGSDAGIKKMQGRLIEQYGSLERYYAKKREWAKRPRPNSKGGSFNNRDFAKKMSAKAIAAKRKKIDIVL